MAESLVALVFLGVTAGSVLSAVTYCQNREEYARHREAIMEILRGKIDQVRANCSGGSVTNGTTTTTVTVKGVQNSVTVSVVISSVSGMTSLKQVDAYASWTELWQGKSKVDQMTFSTWVKPNET